MRKLTLSALAITLFASVAAAEIDFDKGGFNLEEELSKQSAPPQASAPAPEDKGIFDWLFGKPADPKAPKEWTVMVFINAKNNLERFGLKDMNEMEMIGSSSKVNIVVELGRMDGFDASDGDWKGTRRFLIAKDNDTSKISSIPVEDLGKVDMGDYNSLTAFGKWAKEKYPAKKYMMIVWNHGSGWTKGGPDLLTKGISYDDETGHHINTPQLGLALKAMGKLDVYGSDACLMQMAEVVYEIKDSVDYIVGSEETEPGDGYTYDTLLAPLIARPAMSAAELAKLAVDAYSDHYESQATGYTQSYLKSSAIAQLLTLTNEFSYAITVAGEKDLAKSARDAAISFAVEENKDLHHFASLVIAGTKDAEVKAKGQALMTFITSTLVQHHRSKNDPGSWWSGPKDFSTTRGLAIYIPSGSVAGGYADLQWAKYSNWDEFMLWLNQP